MTSDHWVPTPSFLYRNYLYLKLVGKLPKESFFLDVGSGNGDFVKKILHKGMVGESLDNSPKAVNYMKKNLGELPGINIRLGDIFTFKPDRKYDVVFCFEVLEHIKDDSKCIRQAYKLLKPGGVLILSVPAHMYLWDQVDDIKGHYRRYERQELISKVKQAGFLVYSLWSYGFPFLNLIRMLSGSGKLIRSKVPGNMGQKTGESSIQEEYPSFMAPLVTSPVVTLPLFKIMNLFLDTDLGLGYILTAKKPRS